MPGKRSKSRPLRTALRVANKRHVRHIRSRLALDALSGEALLQIGRESRERLRASPRASPHDAVVAPVADRVEIERKRICPDRAPQCLQRDDAAALDIADEKQRQVYFFERSRTAAALRLRFAGGGCECLSELRAGPQREKYTRTISR